MIDDMIGVVLCWGLEERQQIARGINRGRRYFTVTLLHPTSKRNIQQPTYLLLSRYFVVASCYVEPTHKDMLLIMGEMTSFVPK